jgi:hypothetical protein
MNNNKEYVSATHISYEESIAKLKKNGIIFFRDIHSTSVAEEIAQLFGLTQQNLDASNNGVTEISEEKSGKNIKNSRAFTRLHLYPHTDRSPLINPPKYVLNWVKEAALEGGESLLVDGWLLFKEMKDYYPAHLKILQKAIATFTDGINTYIGPIFKSKNQKTIIRFRDDDCVLFSDEAKESIKCLKELIDQHLIVIKLNDGEGYLIDNTRWLHGRNGYSGHRFICRMHIEEQVK